MQLQLRLETNSDIDVILKIVYAFTPTYTFTHIGQGVLETIIDAAHTFTDAQWAIIASAKYTVTFVLPESVAPATTVAPAEPVAA